MSGTRLRAEAQISQGYLPIGSKAAKTMRVTLKLELNRRAATSQDRTV